MKVKSLDRYEVLLRTCFVVSPIGDEGSATRRAADGVLAEIIRPALGNAFDVRRADEDKTPGVITVKVVRSVLEADLVVADLTDLNPNVLYELAIRHAARRPAIQICTKGQTLPFDVAQLDTIFYTNDLAGRAPAIQAIVAALQAVERGQVITNPVSLVQDLTTLAKSPFAGGEVVADQLQDLRRAVAELRTDISDRGDGRPRAPGAHAMDLLGAATLSSVRLREGGFSSLTLAVAGDDSVELAGVFNGLLYQELVSDPDWWIQSDQRVRELGNRLVEGLLRQASRADTKPPAA